MIPDQVSIRCGACGHQAPAVEFIDARPGRAWCCRSCGTGFRVKARHARCPLTWNPCEVQIEPQLEMGPLL